MTYASWAVATSTGINGYYAGGGGGGAGGDLSSFAPSEGGESGGETPPEGGEAPAGETGGEGGESAPEGGGGGGEKPGPLLVAPPARREDEPVKVLKFEASNGMTTTVDSKNNWYKPVEYDKRTGRQQRMHSQANTNLASNTVRNIFHSYCGSAKGWIIRSV